MKLFSQTQFLESTLSLFDRLIGIRLFTPAQIGLFIHVETTISILQSFTSTNAIPTKCHPHLLSIAINFLLVFAISLDIYAENLYLYQNQSENYNSCGMENFKISMSCPSDSKEAKLSRSILGGLIRLRCLKRLFADECYSIVSVCDN